MNLDSYKDFLKINYPQAFQFLSQKHWQPLFFSESIDLPINIYKQIQKTVQSLYQLKNNKNYQKKLLPAHLAKQSLTNLTAKKQDSVLMAYDFHLNNNTAKLVEVNTNASAFLLVNSLYQAKNLNYKKALEDLKRSFQQEWNLFNNKSAPPKKTVLLDEEPLNQKMAIEFYMYKDFFKSMGWNMEILDSKLLKADDKHCLYTPKNEKIDFIYNRSTDFYFENHPLLAKAYQKSSCLILPQPKDYFLLADKARMSDWLAENWIELKSIKNNLLKTQILNPDNKQDMWQNRKKYFFKISQGHGGKMAYKGASLSRKKFEELFQYHSLAQEYIAPSKIKDSSQTEWKTDLRAYVYKDQIQQLASRVYQGQLTNFKASGSGWATIKISS